MQTYLQSIRDSALSILDHGRSWDGGIFKLIGENHIMYNAVINKTLDRKLLMGDVKSTVLSGGTLIAIVFTVLLMLALLAVTLISIYCRRKPYNPASLSDSKLRSRVRQVNQQLPISLRLLLGIVCVIVLLMSLIPLVLSFATNSRLHASVADTQTTREGTMASQIKQVFKHADNFLKNFIPEAREDIKPVIRRTLEMTSAMKAKSQGAYQHEFREVIGANKLTNCSDDLLDRIELYYNSGLSLRLSMDMVYGALNDLKRTQLHTYEEACQRSLGSNSNATCRNHTVTIGQTLQYVDYVHSNWSRPTASNSKVLRDELKDVETFLGNLVGTLDGTGNTPDKQRELKEKKVNISIEFNRNISSVFDRELNSTEFVLNGVEDKLADLEEKIESARGSLQNSSVRAQSAYSRSSSKLESIRFGATTVLLVLLLITLVYLTTGSAIILLVPDSAKAKSRGLICSVYASYATYTIAIIFVCILFCLTSYLQTENCRYLYEEKTADGFLVPEVNAVIAELKDRAARDPNKTDAIPLKRVGRLIGGLLDGCRDNQPIVQALDAVKYVDTESSNSAEESLKFKEKGRDILRREMSSANLEVLRDETMEDKMNSLRLIFSRYSSFDFASVGMHVAQQKSLLEATQQLLYSLRDLNEYIDASLSASEDSTKKLSQINGQNIQTIIHAVSALLNVTISSEPMMLKLESQKAVVPVIDEVILSNRKMDSFLSNQTLWTEAAVRYYTKHVIEGSAKESKAISDSTTIGFLSSVAKCRELYNFYQAFVGVPCKSLLYPMSILWFCIAWFLWFAVLFSLLVHLSLTYFVDRPDTQQQQQPIDDSVQLSKCPPSNGDRATTQDEATAQNPLLTKA